MDATATVVRGPQCMRALERANEVRIARAELKRRVAEGELRPAEVILTCPWEAQSMAVADLLMSQRQWGRTRTRRFLAEVPMSEAKTIGSMTERQRLRLADQLVAVHERGEHAAPAALEMSAAHDSRAAWAIAEPA